MKKILTLLLSLIVTSAFSQPVIEWQRALGGSGEEFAYSIQPTSDGGYITAGYTTSANNGDVGNNQGESDCWVVKLDAAGDIEWQRTLGGSDADGAISIQQTSDGGYIMGAGTESDDGDVSGHHNNADYWVVKLDETGGIEWQRTLGGTANEHLGSVVATTDGGYFVCGLAGSTNGDVTGNHGVSDVWVVKLNSSGVMEWQRALGGSAFDYANESIQTADGGYLISGFSRSIDGDLSFNLGDEDMWIIKLTATGDLEWSKTFGGNKQDQAYAIRQTADGGYVVAGSTNSTNIAGLTLHGSASTDVWLLKLTPGGELEWEQNFGGSEVEIANALELTQDGGFILLANSFSDDGDLSGNHGSTDLWIIRLDASGNLIWQKSIGGTGDDQGFSIFQTADGGFILSAGSDSNDHDVSGNHGDYDMWVVKLSSGITGLEEASGGETAPLTVFPNPASSLLRISIDRESLPQTAAFADLGGKVLYTKPIDNDGHVEIAELPAGVYLLTVTDDNGVRYLGKVVKQ